MDHLTFEGRVVGGGEGGGGSNLVQERMYFFGLNYLFKC